jgi:hypothetical protein
VGRDDDAAVTNEDEVDEVGISQDELLLIPNINHTHTHTHTHASVHTHSISPTHSRYVSHYHQYNIHGLRFRELRQWEMGESVCVWGGRARACALWERHTTHHLSPCS